MAEWNRNKVEPSEINGGKEFAPRDNLAVNELNAIVNNSFYGVNFSEAMADTPDISEIDGDGTPSVSLINNGKYKRFKFSNLKGKQGEQGIKGDKGDTGEKGDKGDPNTLTIGTVESGETASATITGVAPNQVLNLVLPKGEKGDSGTGGSANLSDYLSVKGGEMSGDILFKSGNVKFQKTENGTTTNYTMLGEDYVGSNASSLEIRGSEITFKNRPTVNGTEIATVDDIPSGTGTSVEIVWWEE